MGDLERMLGLFGPLWIVMIVRIGLAGAVAIAAGRRGYNQYVRFLGCLVISPVVGLVLLAILTGHGGPGRSA